MQFHTDSPITDSSKLNVLQESALLDTLPEKRFDRLTRLAADALHVPVVLITLVDEELLFFVSSQGLPDSSASGWQSSPSRSLTQHVVTSGEPLVISDLRKDRRANVDPSLQESGVVAYAGIPLRTAENHIFGALSVGDRSPREWTGPEIDMLENLAVIVGGEIDHRIELRRSGAAQFQAEVLEFFRQIAENSLAGIYLVHDGPFLYVNPRLAEIFGFTPEEIVGKKRPEDLVAEEDRARVAENIKKRLDGRVSSIHYTFRGLKKDGSLIYVEVLGSRTEISGQPAVVGTLLDVTERVRATAALKRREEHFRSLLANSWDIIHEVGADGAINYISPSVERALGYTPEEMVGRQANEFVHPDDLPEASRAFAEKIQSPGTIHSMEMRLRHKDGSWRTVEIQATVLMNGSEEPVVIVNTHDITATRETEKALQTNEERYRLVAHAANSAIRDWNVNSGACVWNGASSTLLRYTRDEIGSNVEWWYERIHSEDRNRVINGIQAVLDGIGGSWSAEYRFLRGDGVYATVLDTAHVTRDKRGIPVRVTGSLVDVTERRRNEEAQRFLARASMLLNEDLKIETVLASLARLTVPSLADYCLIDLIEKDQLRRVTAAHVDPEREAMLLQNEFHPIDGDPEHHPVIKVIRTGEPVLVTDCTDAVMRRISHDEEHYQKLKDMEVSSFMIVPLLTHGSTLGVLTLVMTQSKRQYKPWDLLVGEDLANRAALAIDHAKLYDAAQEAIRMREEVMGVVSHDLRNPLSIIHMGASYLIDLTEDRRSQNAQMLERILKASEQMTHMIEDLLDVSSIEAGKFSIARTTKPVSVVVREANELLLPLSDEKSIRLTYSVAEDAGNVSVDFPQILRVFSNLVGNAFKFTPEGGEITIEADRQGTDVHFRVVDSGPGLKEEQLSQVFDRYWQAEKGDRRGAGLGLSICKGIVEAHGGRIWAECKDGGGGFFCFTIPAAEAIESSPRTIYDHEEEEADTSTSPARRRRH